MSCAQFGVVGYRINGRNAMELRLVDCLRSDETRDTHAEHLKEEMTGGNNSSINLSRVRVTNVKQMQLRKSDYETKALARSWRPK